MEAELLGVSKYPCYNLWVMNILKCQRYGIMNNIVYQGNQSILRTDDNWGNSCTRNSRHINISFFSKERVDKGEVKIEYYPTQMLLADHFTKPLEVNLFKIFLDVIMGYKPISSLKNPSFNQ